MAGKFDRKEVGYDFVENNPYPYDVSENMDKGDMSHHGSEMADLASRGSNRLGILALRVPIFTAAFQPEKRKAYYDAIDYAYKHGSRIVNRSFGDKGDKSIMGYLEKAIQEHPDILFIAGAGNDGSDKDARPVYPANFKYPNLLTVASVGERGFFKSVKLSQFSNYGKFTVQIAAPGEDIPATSVMGTPVKVSGTSPATAIVTNVCAKIMEINPRLTPKEIIEIIRTIATYRRDLEGRTAWESVINEAAALKAARASLQM